MSNTESPPERITPQEIAESILGPIKALFKRNDKENGKDSNSKLKVGVVNLSIPSMPLNLTAFLESLTPKSFGPNQFPGIWADGKTITITQVDDIVNYRVSYEKTLYIPHTTLGMRFEQKIVTADLEFLQRVYKCYPDECVIYYKEKSGNLISVTCKEDFDLIPNNTHLEIRT